MSTTGTCNERAAAALLDELWRCGVREVCISPGGRSTPLAVALARDSRLRPWVITDERSSAFFALGAAVASGNPVAAVCTSGTAAANFLPAAVEAFWSEVPLLLVTADRPPELRDCGAPQTIRQDGLFGRHVKWGTELATPDADVPFEPHVRAAACRAVGVAMTAPRGPVHLNVPYREPLLADATTRAAPPPDPTPAARTHEHAFTTVHPPRLIAADTAITDFAARAPGACGIVVCGPRIPETDAGAIVALASALGWPILADPLSGLRHGPHDRSGVVDAYDVLLRDPSFATRHQPLLVLRFGAAPTSKPLSRFLGALAAEQTLVTTSAAWPDPELAVARVVMGEGGDFCRRVLESCSRAAGADAHWLGSWTTATRAVRATIDGLLAAGSEVFEGAIAQHITASLPAGALLMVGNSMPVRDIDTFVASSGRTLRMVANRGANGIDGVLSSALGMAAVHPGATCLLLGDLSFLHDVGALQIAARHALDLCVVVANNDGGGIFSYLPQATLGEVFEPFFGTPHGIALEPAVRMCGGAYTLAPSLAALDDALRAQAGGSGLRVIEVPTRREYNVTRHRDIVACALAAAHGEPREVARAS